MENRTEEVLTLVSKTLRRDVKGENIVDTVEELCYIIEDLRLGKPVWMK